jgi:alpha-glucosidase
MKKLCIMALVGVGFCAVAQTVSVKSPDGRNEIRLDTEPVLSYSVYHSGLQRIAPTPLSLEVEGKGVLGGSAKISSIDTVTLKGKIQTPIYKKASIDEAANRTTVAFEGNWRVVLVARNDGVAYRFETAFPGRIKVKNETAGIVFPDGVASAYAGYCRDRGDPLQCSWESVYTTVTNMSELASAGQVV